MSELLALLDAIRANPEDDLPRLALADWCQEQPDAALRARGEFIHLRCRAASLALDDPQRAALEWQAQQLRCRHEHEWLQIPARLLHGWDFERGMVLIEVTHESLRQHSLDRLAREPGWVWVIGVRGVLLLTRDVHRLAGSSHLAQLTSLDLRDSDVRSRGAEILAGSAHAQQLASLQLGYCGIGDAGTSALAESPQLGRLTTLGLCNNSITRTGARALAGSPHLAGLTALNLSRNRIGDDGARALAGGRLEGLRFLSLCSCNLSDGSALTLSTSPQLERLDLLDLSDNRLSAAAREELRERFGGRVRLVTASPRFPPPRG